MEKINLNKFKSLELNKFQLSQITAGDECTGGGFQRTFINGGNSYREYSWTSDTVRTTEDGLATWTEYEGYSTRTVFFKDHVMY